MRKQCRRRHYALTNPIALAIAGACVTDDGRLDKLQLRELSAIDAFANRHIFHLSDHQRLAAFPFLRVCRLLRLQRLGEP